MSPHATFAAHYRPNEAMPFQPGFRLWRDSERRLAPTYNTKSPRAFCPRLREVSNEKKLRLGECGFACTCPAAHDDRSTRLVGSPVQRKSASQRVRQLF